MAYEKKDIVKGVTARGVMVWPKLFEPDFKFKTEGEYYTKLRLNGEDAENLIYLIDTVVKKEYSEQVNKAATPKAKAAIKYADPAYKEEMNDDNEPTGFTVFNFKMKASYLNKDGKTVKRSPAVFDSVGNPLAPCSLMTGTEGKVAYAISPYYTPSLGVGASLRLEAVQIIKAVTGTASDAKGFGFKEEDGGFTVQDVEDDSGEGLPFDDADF
jgi:hypothetical protein